MRGRVRISASRVGIEMGDNEGATYVRSMRVVEEQMMDMLPAHCYFWSMEETVLGCKMRDVRK